MAMRVAGALPGAKALQHLAQVLLALAADARNLLAAGEIVAVAEHALVLLGEGLALLHPGGVGRRRAAGAGTGGSVPMWSEKPRRSASVKPLATAVIAGLLRRPSRNRNSWVIV